MNKNGQGTIRNGYKIISVEGRQVAEHRHLMEKMLGRKLSKNEHIHHLDENKLNNSLSNLVLVSNSEHQKMFHKRTSYPQCRRYKTLLKLPVPYEEGEIVTIRLNYRTFITKVCPGCNKLVWFRKDKYIKNNLITCSPICGHIIRGNKIHARLPLAKNSSFNRM